ncbi:MAG TPA: hypothetical protein VEU62_18725 [Bryobacterales bacterium]|nr:hypothetical protein [Bryobacterales bacterium]
MAKANLVNQGYQFIRHIVPAIVRPAHTLWHEVIGCLFLALAAWPIPSGIRAIRQLDAGNGSVVRVILTGAFILIMGGYGISSFRRARKISRS